MAFKPRVSDEAVIFHAPGKSSVLACCEARFKKSITRFTFFVSCDPHQFLLTPFNLFLTMIKNA